MSRRFVKLQYGDFCGAGGVSCFATSRGNKEDCIWIAPGITIRRNKHALSHYMYNFLEVDLDDIPPAGKILGALGLGGTLQFHLRNSKSPLLCLVGSETLAFCREFGMEF